MDWLQFEAWAGTFTHTSLFLFTPLECLGQIGFLIETANLTVM